MYLIQDLGNTTLFQLSFQRAIGWEEFPDELLSTVQQVLENSCHDFKSMAGRDLNYSICYPRARFDKQSMLWDLNYFKYYFLKLAKIPFDEQLLEDDFQRFTDYLLQTNCEFFMYRDFQSRNVMIYQRRHRYFIDYQGGRKGALQYDVASLLYDAKADIPQAMRIELLHHYIEGLQRYTHVKRRISRIFLRICPCSSDAGHGGFWISGIL